MAISPKIYLNGGVFLINDQYAFNHLLDMENLKIRCLPNRFNAQIIANPLNAKNTNIVHLFSGDYLK